MAKIQMFKGYQGEPPLPKPDKPVQPNIVTVHDGVPVKYPGCDGVGVRVVHPANPKAPAQNVGLVMFYVPPHAIHGAVCLEAGVLIDVFSPMREDFIKQG